MDGTFIWPGHSNAVMTFQRKEDGVKFFLKGIRFGDQQREYDYHRWEFEWDGTPGGEGTLAWLKANFPRIHFVNPREEEALALKTYHDSIGERAVEKYKRENGLA